MPRPKTGLSPALRLRAEIVALLRGGNAHVDTRTVLDGIPFERIDERIEGAPYSLWELVYHLWFAQRDILLFTLGTDYEACDWPDDYWPSHEATPELWAETLQSFQSELDRFVELVEDMDVDLTAEFDHAPGYTLLRQALLAADHNAHHLGQIVLLRRQLGIWDA